MYLDHFNLNKNPFSLTPDPSMFFPKIHGDIFRTLELAIERGNGLVKVVGEVGTGKTLLGRMLAENLSEKNYEVAYIVRPAQSYERVVEGLCEELKVPSTGSAERSLEKFLLSSLSKGKRVVLILDEAQCLNRVGMESIRLLSNYESIEEKLIQIVLFGQPELDEMLSSYALRQINQRIPYAFHLPFLDLFSSMEYVLHRLMQCSHDVVQKVFSYKALECVGKKARGVPRLLNILAEKSCLIAFLEGAKEVSVPHVKRAFKDNETIFKAYH